MPVLFRCYKIRYYQLRGNDMAQASGIGWTHHTMNPWRGCQRVSPGCKNCYAETQSGRNHATLGTWGSDEQGGTRVVAADAQWNSLVKWNRAAAAGACHVCLGRGSFVRKSERIDCTNCNGHGYEGDGSPYFARVFVASFADIFEDWRCKSQPNKPGPMIDSHGNKIYVFGEPLRWVTECDVPQGLELDVAGRPLTMADVRARTLDMFAILTNLFPLFLTKRPENVGPMMDEYHHGGVRKASWDDVDRMWTTRMHLGATVETHAFRMRINKLRNVPGPRPAVRFLSLEPLLNNLGDIHNDLHGIDWIIPGGESGTDARVFQVDDAGDIIDNVRAMPERPAIFFKQMGDDPRERTLSAWPGGFPDRAAGVPPIEAHGDGFGNHLIRGLTGKGDVPAEWPERFRVQEFPIMAPRGIAA